jgi:hypothetical protein
MMFLPIDSRIPAMRRLAFVLPILAVLLAGMSQDELRSDMVRLDKVYIAALALSSQGKVAETRQAMNDLTRSWQGFDARYRAANPADAQWTKDFDAVSRLIGEAAGIAASDRKVTDVHESLEYVRIVLARLRARNGMDYFVDRLTAFHEPMEGIVLAAKDKTGAQLTDADLAKIRALLPQAQALWQGASTAPFDAGTYQLDTAAYAKARQLMQREQESLDQLAAALAAGDRARIAKAAVAIKPSFAALFMTFADFRPYRT